MLAHQALISHQILLLSDATERAQLSFSTVSRVMAELANLGIASKITGAQRNRFFVYDAYLTFLSEATEPL